MRSDLAPGRTPRQRLRNVASLQRLSKMIRIASLVSQTETQTKAREGESQIETTKTKRSETSRRSSRQRNEQKRLVNEMLGPSVEEEKVRNDQVILSWMEFADHQQIHPLLHQAYHPPKLLK